MEALLLALLGVFGAGTLSAIPLGIRAARLTGVTDQLANMTTERDKWRDTAGTLQKAVERQEAQDQRTADGERLANQILTGMRTMIQETR
jgi:hypothetical protein